MTNYLEKTYHDLSMWETIRIFHEKFGIQEPEEPTDLPPDVLEYRVKFLLEELIEYIYAKSLEDKIDALVDLVFVAMGTAHLHGFDWPSHWTEVYEANMKKRRAASAAESKREHSLDIVKPQDWQPPDHSKILNKVP